MGKRRFYNDEKFLGSMSGRPLRILSEYLGPLSVIRHHNIKDTIVFFGSARIRDKHDSSINQYYGKARKLAKLLTEWNMENYQAENRFIITSGAGPGIMQAANQGAKDAGGKSVGLGISLPFEQTNNKFITKGLNFVFHYFFMRKFWFTYLTKGIVVWPGGFGTLDELFDILTLLQCKKITRKIPIVLFGSEFWDGLINWDKLIQAGTISPEDVKLFVIKDSVEDTFNYLTRNMRK
ncbi:MAG: LOG family protein [Candidatus Marinimicrobia bacterium]|jgi:hypothetical protein|nr:LOG family protein [Candidatus Neomarinimicrobiota bacterium]MDP6853634.1 LOG family protein [Candidatus Neomarinimicrobiota bacterium]MDP7027971.1 LOG family protein [Candidatus Neomarinimicrobiota bacterium]